MSKCHQTLGAHIWMRSDPHRSLSYFPDGIYDADDCLQAMIKAEHRELKNLEELGAAATRTKPANDNRSQIVKQMTWKKELSARCFPPYTQEDWYLVDASVPSSESDDTQRLERGPVRSENSCAVDCVMVAALLLDGGRRHIDQVDSAFHRTLSFPARALLRMLLKPWSMLSQTQIDTMRNTLQHILQAEDPERFKIGDYLAIGQVANVLLSGMPQLLTTITKVIRCADGHGMAFRTTDDTTVRTKVMLGCLGDMDSTRTSWEIPAGMERNPGALMSLYFQPRPATKEELKRNSRRCCEREDCPGTEMQRVVVDRLAPVLMLEGNSEGKGFTFNPKASFEITYCDESMTKQTATYRIIGVVYDSGSHFSLEWYIGRNKLVYDGMLEASIRSKRIGRLSSAKKALVFMERVGEISTRQ